VNRPPAELWRGRAAGGRAGRRGRATGQGTSGQAGSRDRPASGRAGTLGRLAGRDTWPAGLVRAGTAGKRAGERTGTCAWNLSRRAGTYGGWAEVRPSRIDLRRASVGMRDRWASGRSARAGTTCVGSGRESREQVFPLSSFYVELVFRSRLDSQSSRSPKLAFGSAPLIIAWSKAAGALPNRSLNSLFFLHLSYLFSIYYEDTISLPVQNL
jgi:hypothetical protein